MPLQSRETLLNDFKKFQLKLRSIIPSKSPDLNPFVPTEDQITILPSLSVFAGSPSAPNQAKALINYLTSTPSVPEPYTVDALKESQQLFQHFQQVTKRRGKPRKQPLSPHVANPTQTPHPLVFNY